MVHLIETNFSPVFNLNEGFGYIMKYFLLTLLLLLSNIIYANDTDCLKCHLKDGDQASKSKIYIDTSIVNKSVHKKLYCSDCHAIDPNEEHQFKTDVDCGSCHEDVLTVYSESVHGVALQNGIKESPNCTDCHGGHNIISHFNPDSKVYTTNVPKTCSECHTSERIVGKFGLKADRIKTFNESFHGIANELGESSAANCASCHGVHNIYTIDNPKSLIHNDNIEATCGKCHIDLPPDFAHGTIHKSASDESSGGEFFVRKFYYIFITIIILGFILYRILEYKRRVKRVE